MIVRRTLRQAGFDIDVAEATYGQEALAMLRTGTYSAMLCDWNLPERTSLELLQALADEDITVPVGFVTSETSPEMRTTAYGAGKFMIRKPCAVETFPRAIGGALARLSLRTHHTLRDRGRRLRDCDA